MKARSLLVGILAVILCCFCSQNTDQSRTAQSETAQSKTKKSEAAQSKSVDCRRYFMDTQEGMRFDFEVKEGGKTFQESLIFLAPIELPGLPKDHPASGKKLIPMVYERDGNIISTTYYYFSPIGLLVCAVKIEGKEIIYQDANEYFLKDPIKIGASWKTSSTTKTIEALDETVTVPSGTFKNCLRIRATYPNGRELFLWLTPGAGRVKSEYYETTKPGEEAKLIKRIMATKIPYKVDVTRYASAPKQPDAAPKPPAAQPASGPGIGTIPPKFDDCEYIFAYLNASYTNNMTDAQREDFLKSYVGKSVGCYGAVDDVTTSENNYFVSLVPGANYSNVGDRLSFPVTKAIALSLTKGQRINLRGEVLQVNRNWIGDRCIHLGNVSIGSSRKP